MIDEKILQNEKLDDEELEKISGGTPSESADDSRFLNVLLQGTKYHHCDRYGEVTMALSSSAADDVEAAWKSLGIDTSVCWFTNRYFLNGKEISRDEAWAHAEKTVGKHLTKEQWNW